MKTKLTLFLTMALALILAACGTSLSEKDQDALIVGRSIIYTAGDFQLFTEAEQASMLDDLFDYNLRARTDEGFLTIPQSEQFLSEQKSLVEGCVHTLLTPDAAAASLGQIFENCQGNAFMEFMQANDLPAMPARAYLLLPLAARSQFLQQAAVEYARNAVQQETLDVQAAQLYVQAAVSFGETCINAGLGLEGGETFTSSSDIPEEIGGQDLLVVAQSCFLGEEHEAFVERIKELALETTKNQE